MQDAIAGRIPAGKGTKIPQGDRIFYIVVYIGIILLTLSVAYPMIYVLSSSFSSGTAVSTGKVAFLPVDFSLEGYKRVLTNPKVFIGYRNTIFYTVAGTALNVFMTMICAYPLARRGLPHRNLISYLFVFTMLFSGGMVPAYLLMRSLNLLNRVWVLIIPGALGVYQMIIARTFIQSTIPEELHEAVKMDGCNDFRYFTSFVMPLSKAVIAVIALQYAVGHWNSYLSAYIYINDRDLYPLQVFLREILIMSQIEPSDIVDEETAAALQGMADVLKYALIVVATAPILCVYPFIQRFFIQGVMIGSIKG